LLRTSPGHDQCGGSELTLPFDVEPYGPEDSDFAAGKRLLRRAVSTLERRFADYVVGDGEYAMASFLNLAMELGLKAVARLKGNLPQLHAAAQLLNAASPNNHHRGCLRKAAIALR